MYVSDFPTDEAVKVYAPGAHGNAQPIRTLTFGGHEPERVAVNPQGYLFVGLDNTYVNIYPPLASGAVQPIHTIEVKSYILDMLSDSTGRLYVSSGPGTFVYDDPLRRWQQPDRTLTEKNEYAIGGAIALDEAHDQIYLQFFSNRIHEWDAGDFAARRLDANTPDRLIFTRDCPNYDDGPGQFLGLVVSGDYLLASCSNYNVLWVYDADQFGRQRLIEKVGSGLFQTADDLKLGP